MAGLGRVYSLDELAHLITPVMQKHQIKSATLFGSYAKGTMTKDSDIDLVVDTSKWGLDFISILSDLFDVFGYGTVDLYAKRELSRNAIVRSAIAEHGVKLYGE